MLAETVLQDPAPSVVLVVGSYGWAAGCAAIEACPLLYSVQPLREQTVRLLCSCCHSFVTQATVR